MAVGLRYQEIVLSSAGISLPRELMQRVSQRAQQLFKEMRFVLFEDVLSTLKTLKRYKLIIGLLTNAPKNILSNLKLGHEPFIDFVVTSEEAGADKPHPSIFLMALERAKVGSSQAIYVGDQYEVDIVGARGVGLRAVLLDRCDLFANIECPRIRQLPEVIKLLDI